jgi:hypothetical protein
MAFGQQSAESHMMRTLSEILSHLSRPKLDKSATVKTVAEDMDDSKNWGLGYTEIILIILYKLVHYVFVYTLFYLSMNNTKKDRLQPVATGLYRS